MFKEFYDNAFIQTGKHLPPNADKSGKTVTDRAPKMFCGTYHGSQGASKVIIGVLDVILSHFERTLR